MILDVESTPRQNVGRRWHYIRAVPILFAGQTARQAQTLGQVQAQPVLCQFVVADKNRQDARLLGNTINVDVG